MSFAGTDNVLEADIGAWMMSNQVVEVAAREIKRADEPEVVTIAPVGGLDSALGTLEVPGLSGGHWGGSVEASSRWGS